MKTLSGALALLLLTALLIVSVHCKRSNPVAAKEEPISQDVLTAIAARGYSTDGVIKVPKGYIVEKDILLTAADLQRKDSVTGVVVAKNEQYFVVAIVINTAPRTIHISIDNTLPATYEAALDVAIAKYNALGLKILFQKVTAGADISITYAGTASLGAGVEGASGPPANGNPFPNIWLNSDVMGLNPDQGFLATIIAHEAGHCIGFRHTDYMNRAFSCGSGGAETGAAPTWIHGTPTGPDDASWMLACNNFVDRPFNQNDKIALHWMYGYQPVLCGSQSQAIINGVCESAGRRIDSEEYDPIHHRCTVRYYYVWSDGTQSQDYSDFESCP
jgi:hypothetical protein